MESSQAGTYLSICFKERKGIYMSVKVTRVKGERIISTYFLNKEEFVKFITNKVNTARAVKAARADSKEKAE